jgi:hypothetical protein
MNSSFVKVWCILITHRTKHIKVTEAQPLAKAVCQQELDKFTAVLARFTSVKLYNGVETNFSLLDIFCSKCPIEHALEFRPLRRETLCKYVTAYGKKKDFELCVTSEMLLAPVKK